MNEAELIKLLGADRHAEIQQLSKKTADTFKQIVDGIPEGAKIDKVQWGLDGDDFIKNEITVVLKLKIKA